MYTFKVRFNELQSLCVNSFCAENTNLIQIDEKLSS